MHLKVSRLMVGSLMPSSTYGKHAEYITNHTNVQYLKHDMRRANEYK